MILQTFNTHPVRHIHFQLNKSFGWLDWFCQHCHVHVSMTLNRIVFILRHESALHSSMHCHSFVSSNLPVQRIQNTMLSFSLDKVFFHCTFPFLVKSFIELYNRSLTGFCSMRYSVQNRWTGSLQLMHIKNCNIWLPIDTTDVLLNNNNRDRYYRQVSSPARHSWESKREQCRLIVDLH